MKYFYLLLFIVLGASSCSVLKRSSNKELSDGYYRAAVNGKRQLVYVDIEEDTIVVHSVVANVIDSQSVCHFNKQEIHNASTKGMAFRKSSFDIDLLTLPVKYRPAKSGVPAQINTNINGSAYIGYRSDFHIVNYRKGKLKQSDRTINHYGYSLGIFSGIGNTAMNPTNTAGFLSQEYDGVVWLKGIAGFLAVNNYTIGLAVGSDHLLDRNHRQWIYQGRCWLGLAFGINLN